MKIEIPNDGSDKQLLTRWEKYLTERSYKFNKKGTMGSYVYHVEVEDAQNAFWLGCNYIAMMHRLYDGPLTTTGTTDPAPFVASEVYTTGR